MYPTAAPLDARSPPLPLSDISTVISIITPDIIVDIPPPLGVSLALNVQHELEIPFGSVVNLSSPLNTLLEIVPASDLSLECLATIGHHNIAARDLHGSAILEHLRSFLDTNLSHLGLQSTSPCVIEQDTAKFYLNSNAANMCCTPCADWQPVLKRLRLHYKLYLRKSSASSPDTCSCTPHPDVLNPFGSTLTLPYFVACNRLCNELVVKHLMRYPRVFSPYNEKCATLSLLWDSIARNVINIAERSPSPDYQKSMHSRNKRLDSALSSERLYLQVLLTKKLAQGTSEDAQYLKAASCSSKSIIALALQELHRAKFKPVIKLIHRDYNQREVERLEEDEEPRPSSLSSPGDVILHQIDEFERSFLQPPPKGSSPDAMFEVFESRSTSPLLPDLHGVAYLQDYDEYRDHLSFEVNPEDGLQVDSPVNPVLETEGILQSL